MSLNEYRKNKYGQELERKQNPPPPASRPSFVCKNVLNMAI